MSRHEAKETHGDARDRKFLKQMAISGRTSWHLIRGAAPSFFPVWHTKFPIIPGMSRGVEPHCNVHDQLVDGSRARKYPQFDLYTAQMQALILMLHMKTHRLPTGHYGSLADLRGDFAFGGFMTLNGHRLSTANAEKFRHEILSNAISCYLCGYSARAMQRHQFQNVRDYYRMLKGIGEMAISFSATWLIERA